MTIMITVVIMLYVVFVVILRLVSLVLSSVIFLFFASTISCPGDKIIHKFD